MKLRHAILGLLAGEPLSGYDISRAFASSVVYFWHADQSQVYRTIDRLEARRFHIRPRISASDSIEYVHLVAQFRLHNGPREGKALFFIVAECSLSE